MLPIRRIGKSTRDRFENVFKVRREKLGIKGRGELKVRKGFMSKERRLKRFMSIFLKIGILIKNSKLIYIKFREIVAWQCRILN